MEEKKYRIAKFHAEMLDNLKNGVCIFEEILEPDEIEKKIQYESYNEDAEIVKYLKKNNINLLYDQAQAPNGYDIDLVNSIYIREFLNDKGCWKLSSYIRNFLYAYARYCLDVLKENEEYFQSISRDATKELATREHFLSEKTNEDSQTSVNDYLSESLYISDCFSGAEAQWMIIKPTNLLSQRQYQRMSMVFGAAEIFQERLDEYNDILYGSLMKNKWSNPKTWL